MRKALIYLLFLSSILCPAVEGNQVTLTHLSNSSHNVAHRNYVEEKARAFTKAHPSIFVDVVASPGNYVEKILVAAAAGVPYDIVEPTSAQIADIVSQGLLLDIRPLLKKGGLSEADFIPVALLPFRWDAALVGLPSEINAVTTTTNVRLLREAGLATPLELGSAWNWDTLRAMAPKLSRDTRDKGANDRWAVTINPAFHRVLPAFVHNAGGDVFDAQIQPRNSTFLKDPAVSVGLQFYLDLYWRDWLTNDPKTFRSEQTTAISLEEGSWWIFMLEQLAEPFEYEVAPFPAGPARQASEVLANGFCISSGSQNAEEAFEWIRFLAADYDNVISYMRETGRPSAYLKATPRFLTLFSDKHPKSISVWIDVLTHPDVRIRTVTPVYTAIKNEFDKRLREVMAKTRGLNDFLEHMHRFTQARLDEVWKD